MVEKPDAGFDVAFSLSVQIERKLYFGFSRDSFRADVLRSLPP
jgi:hypothetical protein